MRKLLAFGASVLMSLAAWGAYPEISVNGEALEKAVTSLTFDGDNVIVHFGDESESYDMESVSITFPNTLIDKVEMHSLRVNVGDMLTVDGTTPGTMLNVYNAAGRLCVRAKAESTCTEVNLSDCNPGVYLLLVDDKCVKFVKR